MTNVYQLLTCPVQEKRYGFLFTYNTLKRMLTNTDV